ncbi:glycosyltransferase family 2 protein [Streptococcus sp. sy004]|uniref:glycosyltransferase family 2 protein n=1 Tax=Streptococcus sp. sy004 TaxID=2600149 RepID=UPI0021BD12AF|nr:glycosyltransferase family 2 protein [Streptococcus sp. sy004]
MKNKVLALVVTYNRKDLLLECVDALLKQELACDILVIDNASTDGTQEVLSPFVMSGQIGYINTGENLGGAGGFNFALKEGASRDYDYFWLMDDDTIAHPDTLQEFMNAANALDNHFGYLSSFARFTDGKPCQMNLQDVTKDWYEGIEVYNGLVKIERATFVSFFIKKETVMAYGLPIKEFFIWVDDTEYSLRIAKHLPCYLVQSSQITHKMQVNASTGWRIFMNENSDRVDRYFYNVRNKFYVNKQNGFLSSVSYLAKQVVLSLLLLFGSKHYRFKKFAIVWKGVFAGLTFNPPIEYLEEKK